MAITKKQVEIVTKRATSLCDAIDRLMELVEDDSNWEICDTLDDAAANLAHAKAGLHSIWKSMPEVVK